MDHSDYWLLTLIRKHTEEIRGLQATLGVVINNVNNLGGNILRDAPSTPEPNPPDLTKVWRLSFRNGAPEQIWDNVNGVWI
jgi:hypothetical protein